MKLWIRSMATKETLRIETPDPCSLHHLKTLVARALSTAASTSSILPETVRVSLNRKDELFASSDQDSLQAMGLTSGDLIYFSIASDSQTLAPSASFPPAPVERSNLHPVSLMDNIGDDDGGASVSLRSVNLALSSSAVHASKENADSSSIGQVLVPDNSTAIATEPIVSQREEVVQEDDKMEVDVEHVITKKSLSVPCFLERVMEAENGEAEGILGRLVITIQAVFLESGFVVTDGGTGDGSRLPEGWSSKAANLSVHYTLPELAGACDGRNAKAAILRFSVMGNYATVYGFLNGAHPDVYRVCFDLPKLAPLLSSFDSLSGSEEKEIFGLWKVVKDTLSLPLLIDICQKNGLPSPACFMLLPTDLKIKILEFLSGIDVSKVGCTCSELRYLSSNNDLWKKKFLEEFGDVDERLLVGRSWKDKYANYWMRKKNAEKRTERNIFHMQNIFVPRFNRFNPQRFPMIGGDHDRFPAIGSLVPGGDHDRFPAIGSLVPGVPRLGFPRLPGRRNFSPNCNLGGSDPGFLG